ncbi:MAG: arginine--tRNA ligase, partial [bacterium]
KYEKIIASAVESEGVKNIAPVLRDIPFKGVLGLALSNVFEMARMLKPDAEKKELAEFASALAVRIAKRLNETGEFEEVSAEKNYVNCIFKLRRFAYELAAKILSGRADWGKLEFANTGRAGSRVMVEYSQPNTHKAFHVGHVRNVALGSALVRCFRYGGHKTLAANYFGDIGTHVFKSLWYLEKIESGIENAPDDIRLRGRWLGEIYAKADSLLDESQELKNRIWDIIKTVSVELKPLWSEKPDSTLKRIALNEEDLFENRPPSEIDSLIENLYRESFVLFDKAVHDGKIETDGETHELLIKLNMIISSMDFREIWDRESEVRDIARRWSAGDEKLVSLWRTTRQWSLDDFDRIYRELDAPFDSETVFCESKVEKEGVKIVDDLLKMGIVTASEGAKIIEIDKMLSAKFGEPEQDKYRVAVLIKADGSSLYAAKDLALAKRKFEDFDIEESVYVVDSSQKFYFEQIFQILRLMGFAQWEKCFHLSYELVMLPGGKMSSRSGNVVFYDDVKEELEKRAYEVVSEKNPDISEDEKQSVARMVAKGALFYGLLRVDTNKKINFDFEEVLDFDGRSAPYIQYAGARASSILRKAESSGFIIPENFNEEIFASELTPAETELLKLLAQFPGIVEKVIETKKPIHLTTYAYDLAVQFNDFYHRCPVLSENENVRTYRLILVNAFRITEEIVLNLLGIPAPSVM